MVFNATLFRVLRVRVMVFNATLLRVLRVRVMVFNATLFRVLRVRLMVFNATFNNLSAISWQSVLFMEETGVPGEYKHTRIK